MSSSHVLKTSLFVIGLLVSCAFLACGPGTGDLFEPGISKAENQVILEKVSMISTVQDTLVPEREEGLTAPFPGAASLFTQLKLGQANSESEIFFITQKDQETEKKWLEDNQFPQGALTSGMKVETFETILKEHPQQRFILLGNDAEIIQQINGDFTAQIMAVLIIGSTDQAAVDSVTTNVEPPAQETPVLHIENFAQAAATLFELKIMDQETARQIMVEAKTQGLELSEAEMDALIAEHTPPTVQATIQEIIEMAAPKYKIGGKETMVEFQHLKHAQSYAGGCDLCHPTLAPQIGADTNTKDVLHNSCKTCHNSGKPAKNFTCKSCHK